MLLYYHPGSTGGHSTKKQGHDTRGQVVAQLARNSVETPRSRGMNREESREIKEVLQFQRSTFVCSRFQNEYTRSLAIRKHFLKSPGSFYTDFPS